MHKSIAVYSPIIPWNRVYLLGRESSFVKGICPWTCVISPVQFRKVSLKQFSTVHRFVRAKECLNKLSFTQILNGFSKEGVYAGTITPRTNWGVTFMKKNLLETHSCNIKQVKAAAKTFYHLPFSSKKNTFTDAPIYWGIVLCTYNGIYIK